ncbi:MAG: DUF1415 domain-containing protein [Chitinophagaceae bacterium]|nr:DUF1415 domain-containing protein [Chitinophagaceae bacterium]
MSNEQIISQTRQWILDVVIACNFCPFAARVMNERKVNYKVVAVEGLPAALLTLSEEIDRLNTDDTIDTSFIIFAQAYHSFREYMDMVEAAEKWLRKNKYEGVYQLASFHPDYCFAGEDTKDASNFTNRSVYPMLHLLRERSIDAALKNYPHPEKIPNRNIRFARDKGYAYMKMLRDQCL